MSTINKRVEQAIRDNPDFAGSEAEFLGISVPILEKYGANRTHVWLVMVLLQRIGFGRNRQTANVLRALADLIESPIPNSEELEAKLDGKRN
jgi:hypothetical protein